MLGSLIAFEIMFNMSLLAPASFLETSVIGAPAAIMSTANPPYALVAPPKDCTSSPNLLASSGARLASAACNTPFCFCCSIDLFNSSVLCPVSLANLTNCLTYA